jgi:hypothetical protein
MPALLDCGAAERYPLGGPLSLRAKLPIVQRLLRWFALVAALAAVVVLLFVPFYEGVSESQSVGGPLVRRSESATLIAGNGARVLLILAIPVVAAISALVPWPPRLRRGLDILAAAIVSVFVLLGAFTVGLFFVPTAAALLAIALWPRQSRAAT